MTTIGIPTIDVPQEAGMCTHDYHEIRPVERNCICLMRPPEATAEIPHIKDCDTRYREKFFGIVNGVKNAFREHQLDSSLFQSTAGAKLN